MSNSIFWATATLRTDRRFPSPGLYQNLSDRLRILFLRREISVHGGWGAVGGETFTSELVVNVPDRKLQGDRVEGRRGQSRQVTGTAYEKGQQVVVHMEDSTNRQARVDARIQTRRGRFRSIWRTLVIWCP